MDRVNTILSYWFGPDYATSPHEVLPGEEVTRLWFRGGKEVDEYIRGSFLLDVEAIKEGRYDPWIEEPLPCLAGIILMDQFTRNIYRNTPEAFALDVKGITWASHMVDKGRDKDLHPVLRWFVYTPFMHQEDLAMQERGVQLFSGLVEELAAVPGYEEVTERSRFNLKYMIAHRDVIAQWGRFPHRNQILGRENTEEEAKGLAEGVIAKW